MYIEIMYYIETWKHKFANKNLSPAEFTCFDSGAYIHQHVLNSRSFEVLRDFRIYQK